MPLTLDRPIAALLFGGARRPPASVPSTTCSTCARAGSSLGQLALAVRRGRARHRRRLHQQPVRRRRSSGSSRPFAVGFTVFWIVGMINSINWIDGLDGLSTGIALIAAVTLGHHQPDDPGQPAAHRGAVLRARRARCSGSCAGTSTRRRSSAARAASSSSATRWPCCRSSARPRSPSRCSCWACRSSTRSGSSSGGCRSGRSPFTPDRSHIHHRLLDLGPVASATRSCSSMGSASHWGCCRCSCPGVTQLYAFLGVFIAVRADPVRADARGVRPPGRARGRRLRRHLRRGRCRDRRSPRRHSGARSTGRNTDPRARGAPVNTAFALVARTAAPSASIGRRCRWTRPSSSRSRSPRCSVASSVAQRTGRAR